MGWVSVGVLLIALAAGVATVAVYAATGVPALPTSPRVLGPLLVLVDRMPRRRVVDLGSGYGTLVLAVAQRCPRAVVTGYEVSPVPYLISKLRVWLARLPNASIRYGNCFDVQLDQVDLALCYLTRKPMARLREKLEVELSLGAELICHTFAVPDWEPIEFIQAKDLYHTRVYRYARPQEARPSARHPWMDPPARSETKRPGLLEA